jgi:hypothetical protein
MNYLKKLSVAALLAFFCSTNSFAETLTVDAPASVAPGATGVLVNINLNTGANTAGASFTVTYDAAKLQYKSVSSAFFATFAAQNISPPTVAVGTPPVTYDKGLVANPSSGKVMLAAAQATNGTAGAKILFTLTFDTISGATGSSVINVTPSTITNAAAGYPTATAIPMLVGISGTTYPTITPSVTSDTITIGSTMVDTDSDGIDDSWETTHFGNLTTATATSDFDKDGYTDKQEYLNGGSYDPKVINPPGGPGYVNTLADTLIVNFTDYGIYTYNSNSSFSQLSSSPTNLTITVDIDSDGKDEIVSYFPGYGVYIYDNGAWGSRIASAVPEAIVKIGNRIAVDFGSAGLYTYSTAENWSRISGSNPTIMTEADVDSDGIMELAVYFPGYGIYIWDNGVWGSRIASAVPEAIVKIGNRIAVDFGSAGLYTYSTTENWSRISGSNPTIMTEADVDSDGVMELAVYFPGYGIYIWDNGVWGSSIASAVPENLVKVGNRLAVDFGSAYGLYTYNTTQNWTRISGSNPTIITEADVDSDGVMELAVYFAGYGIYIWDNGVWSNAPIAVALTNMITCGNIVQ